MLLAMARSIAPKLGGSDEARRQRVETFAQHTHTVALMAEAGFSLSRAQQAEVDQKVTACLQFLNAHTEWLSADDLETIAVAKSRYDGSSIVEDALVF